MTGRDLLNEDRRAIAQLAAEAVLARLREGGTEDEAVTGALEAVYQAGADPDLCRKVAEFSRRKRTEAPLRAPPAATAPGACPNCGDPNSDCPCPA